MSAKQLCSTGYVMGSSRRSLVLNLLAAALLLSAAAAADGFAFDASFWIVIGHPPTRQ